MATSVDITDFHKGELIQISLLAKNPDGTALDNAATTAIVMTIALTDDGAPDLEFSTTEGSITVTDAPTAEFAIALLPSDLTALGEGRRFYYNIWSGTGDARLLQVKGKFKLLNSVEPA